MKPSPPSPVLLALLLAPWVCGPAAGRLGPGRMLRSSYDAAPGARGFSQDYQKGKPGSEFSWILTYVPIRSCHRVLKDKYGEFSPPVYHGDTPMNFWCNWTIWAGSRKHIIIYIQGFITKEVCNKNEDKILFEGVSSLVENSVVYACWKKEMHVFATFAQAVHVVLLKRYLPNCREMQFKGKYYIFQDQKSDSSSKDDVISEASAPKLQKPGSIFHSGWAEDLRDMLGFGTTRSTVSLGKTRVLSSGLLQGGVSTLGTIAVGSPTEIVQYKCARTLLLETKTPCVLGSELQGDLKATPGAIIPTKAQDTREQSLSVSGDITVGFGYMHRLSSVLLETPLLGALQLVEPSLQPAGVGLEDGQYVLQPTLRPKGLGDPQFTIKPTHASSLDLAVHLQSLPLNRRESKKSTDTIMYQGLSTVSLEKDESHSQLNVLADGTVSGEAGGLAKSLMPSLSSLYEVVNRHHLHLLPDRSQRYQSSFGDLSMTQPELGTTGFQHTKLVGISSPECFWRVFKGKTVLHPTEPWDILKEHPQLCGQSSHVQRADPGSLPTNVQAQDDLVAEKALSSSFNVKSCHHQSDRAPQLRSVTPPLPTRLKHLPTVTSTLGTETTPALVVSCTEPVPADFGSTDFTPEALPPPELGPMSRAVFSLPTALDSDPVSFRRRSSISPAGPEDQFMFSPSPPHHPSVAPEQGPDVSPGHLGLGMQKLVAGEVGGQQGQTSASVDSMARGASPASVAGLKPGVGLPQPENNVSSGSGVVPASLSSTWGAGREEHVMPAQYQGMAARDQLASASILRGFKTQKTTEALRASAGEQRNVSSNTVHAHDGPPVQGEMPLRDQKPQEPSDDTVSRNTQTPGGHQQKHAELGRPWAMEYFPISSCHLVFRDGSGMFYLPLHADIKTNIWCNWTIWAGPQKHIVIYVQGFQGSEGCGKNQDKIIFHGVLSSVETKVVYACHNQGTLIFATQATAVHVLFLSESSSLRHEYRHFKGWYYVFRDSETVASSDNTIAPQDPDQEVSKNESWRTAAAKHLLPTVRTSPSPSGVLAGGRIQPELVTPDEETRHPPRLVEDAQSGTSLSEPDLKECDHLWDETELERNLKDGGTEGRETKDDMLVKPSLAGKSARCKDELSILETAKEDAELTSALVTVAPCSSEVPSSNVGPSSKSSSLDQARNSLSEETVAAAHCTQTPALEEPLLNTNTKSPLYPSPGVTAGDGVSPGEINEELFDLVSALASLENDSVLQSQHHPGDVLFEVTIEIKREDWIPHSGSELRKGFLEYVKNHIQENLKLSANRVNEIKLKEIKRMHDANLLLTFWLHLKPEERNMSLLLHSQLEELLGTSVGVEKLQLVSLFVEDVNECSAGVGLCGEEAECFNDVGTYLCRCKKGYEDHSPSKSGTLCIPAPRSGTGFFFRHADILVGAAIMAGLAMLVAAATTLCRAARQRRHPRRNPSPEEPPVGAAEEPAMELHDLGECLRLDPFQLKLRARAPEWLWSARAHTGQAYQVFWSSPPLSEGVPQSQ